MKYVTLHRCFVVVAMIALVMTVATPALAECPCETQASDFAGGDGSPGDPYQVCLPEHLDNVRNHLSASFVQTADIDMSGFENFTPIGHPTDLFNGDFDGANFYIGTLTISFPEDANIGLFGDIAGAARNITLIDANIEGVVHVGGIAGSIRPSGQVINCSVHGTITGEARIGGLIGFCQGFTIQSSSTGNVIGNDAGGLIGMLVGLVENSYSNSDIASGGTVSGGLIGLIGLESTVRNCLSTGVVPPGASHGGLIGFDFTGDAVVEASFWDVDTSGQTTSAGGTGKTTAEMQMQRTFKAWDFTNIWMIDEGKDYPRLQVPDLGCVIDCECDDGNDCNGVETCDAGFCVDGTPVDCGGLDDECAIGTCNPADGLCSQDVLTPLGSVCREAANDCDAEETCDGMNPACPGDACEEAGTSCDAGNGSCDGECNCVSIDIPTVSEWGLIVMTLFLLTSGTLVFGRRRSLAT